MKLARLLAATAAPVLMLGATIAPGYADDISNNLDATVDATAESMSLRASGADGSTILRVITANGDGKNGCNLTGATTLVVSVNSSNSAVATASPSSITFDACGNTPTLTVTPKAAGSTSITLGLVSNNTGATFDLTPATFNVSVAANAAPTVAVTGVTDGAEYVKGDVPAAGCQVTDIEDGNSTKVATLSAITGPNAADGVGSQTASCSYTDAGGLTATASATYTIASPNTAPSVTVNGVTEGADYEWGSVPVATCGVTDAEDGPSSFPASLSAVSGDNADQGIGSQTATCDHTDSGGLAAQQQSVTYSIVPVANTAPTVTVSGVVDGEAYTKGSVPSATCDVVDAEDGNSSFAADLSEITGPHSDKGIGEQTASCSYTDDGNSIGGDKLSDSDSATYTIVPVPNTAPAVSVTGVEDGAEYVIGEVPDAGCDVNDAEDQDATADVVLSDVSGPFGILGIGEQTATCSYTDSGDITGENKLGDTASVTYAIVPVPNTAPTVTVTGVEDGAVYTLEHVPAAGCEVTDGEDGPSTFAATLSGLEGPHANIGLGQQTATCSYTDDGDITGQNKLDDEKSVTYTVIPEPNTAPTVAVTGVEDGAIYTLEHVPAAGCDVTDAEDGSSSFDATLSVPVGPHADLGLGEQKASCTYTDKGNIIGGDKLSDSDSVTYTIIPEPNTAPTVTVTGVEDGAVYNVGEVPDAECDVTDAEDGPWTFDAELSVVTGPYAVDGIGEQTATCSHTDSGNIIGEEKLSDEDSVTFTIVDPTAPKVVYSILPGATPDGDNGWFRTNVTVDWTVTEDESPSSLEATGCDDVDITADQGPTTYTCSASSAGGDKEVTTVSIKRDATDPSLTVTGGPADGASYVFGSVPAAPECSATDNLSGVAAPCAVSGHSALVGQHTVKVTVKDNAGNVSTVSRTYTVEAWTTKGFYAPVDLKGVLNTVKGGSTVPLKFELFAGTTELTDISAVKSFTTQKVNCDGSAPQDALEMTTTGGTSLRYDSTGGQFIQNWKTPTGAGQCYLATMTAQDGSTISALFKLK